MAITETIQLDKGRFEPVYVYVGNPAQYDLTAATYAFYATNLDDVTDPTFAVFFIKRGQVGVDEEGKPACLIQFTKDDTNQAIDVGSFYWECTIFLNNGQEKNCGKGPLVINPTVAITE